MKDDYIIISAYTVNTAYEEEVKDLEECCKKFKYNYKLYPYESTGDWVLNTMQKPKIILQAMEEHPTKDIVWIDADALICQPLKLFDGKFNHDIGIHFYQHSDIPNEVLSGTIYIKNNDKMLHVVKDWASAKDRNLDQRHLEHLIKVKYARKLKILNLPEEYVKIRLQKEDIENVVGVITHKQLSREQRHGIALGLNGDVYADMKNLFPMISDKQRATFIEALRRKFSLSEIFRGMKLPQPSPLLEKNYIEFIQKYDFEKLIAYEHTSQIKTKRLIDLIEYVKNKKVLVIGNSEKIFNKNHSRFINNFDCVIRINGGTPQNKIGNRTDIWVYQFTHYEIPVEKAKEYYDLNSPDFVLRFALTDGTKFALPCDNMIFPNVTQSHNEFFKRGQNVKLKNGNIVNVDSSTGAKVIDFLINQLYVENVHLLGFDFFKSKTHYHDKGTANCHISNLEKSYFNNFIKQGKIILHKM